MSFLCLFEKKKVPAIEKNSCFVVFEQKKKARVCRFLNPRSGNTRHRHTSTHTHTTKEKSEQQLQQQHQQQQHAIMITKSRKVNNTTTHAHHHHFVGATDDRKFFFIICMGFDRESFVVTNRSNFSRRGECRKI